MHLLQPSFVPSAERVRLVTERLGHFPDLNKVIKKIVHSFLARRLAQAEVGSVA